MRSWMRVTATALLALPLITWTSPAAPQTEEQPLVGTIAQPVQLRTAPDPNAPLDPANEYVGRQVQIVGVEGDWYRLKIDHTRVPRFGYAPKSAVYVRTGPAQAFNEADARAADAAQGAADWPTAIRLWTAIVQAGDRSAELDAHDPSRGSPWHREIENLGTAEAMLGVAYLKGTGVPKDLATSANWYVKAHQTFAEDPESCCTSLGVRIMLGTFYAYGVGVPLDGSKAKDLWENTMGSVADWQVMVDYQALPPTIDAFLAKIDAGADYAAGQKALQDGDDEQALRLFLRAAIREEGPSSDAARLQAAKMLMHGTGTAVDARSALLVLGRWHDQEPPESAEMREILGQEEYGAGLAALAKRDYAGAGRGFGFAAIYGGPKASAAGDYEIGVMLRDGLGRARDDKGAAGLFNDSADIRAKRALVAMIAAGRADRVPGDPTAEQLMRKAASDGNAAAQEWAKEDDRQRALAAQAEERAAEARFAEEQREQARELAAWQRQPVSRRQARCAPACASRESSCHSDNAFKGTMALTTSSPFAFGLAVGGMHNCSSVRQSCMAECVNSGSTW